MHHGHGVTGARGRAPLSFAGEADEAEEWATAETVAKGGRAAAGKVFGRQLSKQLIILAAVNRSINSQQDALERMRERFVVPTPSPTAPSPSSPPLPSPEASDPGPFSLDPLVVFRTFDSAIANIDAQVRKFHAKMGTL